jgi:hypothetical protein
MGFITVGLRYRSQTVDHSPDLRDSSTKLVAAASNMDGEFIDAPASWPDIRVDQP